MKNVTPRVKWLPPVRLAAPLLVLVFGLVATWFDYQLALDVNGARDLAEVRARAEMTTRRLAKLCEVLLKEGRPDLVRLQVESLTDMSDLVVAGIVDGSGRVIASSRPDLVGRASADTPLAAAMRMHHAGTPAPEVGEDMEVVYAASPLKMPAGETGWALIELNRGAALQMARDDALLQLSWISAAMVMLSFALWAVLHYGYTSRLATLADRLKSWHAGIWEASDLPKGSDEVGRLSESFSGMMDRLRAYEMEQLRMERELLDISEGERQRIGHDLHDGLGQRLTAASMAANAILEAVKLKAPELEAHGELVTRQLREAIRETRSLAHGLAPVSMEADGLWTALREMAASITSSGKVRCVLEEPLPSSLPDVQTGVQLFRITQEAVNNALKHAEASEIRISLTRQDGRLVLEVEDDGRGLDEARPAAQGLGMHLMRYRASLIRGELEARSADAGGMLIRCTVATPDPSS